MWHVFTRHLYFLKLEITRFQLCCCCNDINSAEEGSSCIRCVQISTSIAGAEEDLSGNSIVRVYMYIYILKKAFPKYVFSRSFE